MPLRVACLAVLGLLLLPLSAGGEPRPEVAPGELIVHFKPGRRPALAAVARRAVKRARPLARDTVALELDERSLVAVEAGLRELRAHPDVARVEPNLIRRPFLTPNDTHFALQWGLKAARLETAWDTTTGSSSIVVAVVDTGILAGHPDLQGRVLAGRDFVTSTAS